MQYAIHLGDEKFKLLSLGGDFTGQLFIGELSEVNSAEVLRQGVKIKFLPQRYVFCLVIKDIFYNLFVLASEHS